MVGFLTHLKLKGVRNRHFSRMSQKSRLTTLVTSKANKKSPGLTGDFFEPLTPSLNLLTKLQVMGKQ